MLLPMIRLHIPAGCTFYVDPDANHECVAINPNAGFLDLPFELSLPHLRRDNGGIEMLTGDKVVYVDVL